MSKQQVIAIIPARGGSKGIPKKNLVSIAGLPLIVHTIRHAINTKEIGRVIVSTDDNEIAEIALSNQAEVIKRPNELSLDSSTTESALIHVLDHLEESEGYTPELVVLLQATSPIRKPDDTSNAIHKLLDSDADSLFSCHSEMVLVWRIDEEGPKSFNFDYKNRLRRQDRPIEVIENGNIYVFKPEILRKYSNRLGGKVQYYSMGRKESIEIDNYDDLELARAIMQHLENL